MNKMTKKFALVLAMALLCMQSFSMISLATVDSTDSVEAIAGCPNSSDGVHHMYGRSTCWAINVNTGEELEGQGAQCKNCHMLIVTENNLFLNPNLPLGKHATRDAWGTEGKWFTIEVTSFTTHSNAHDAYARAFSWESEY